MKVLVGCEESQAVTMEFRKLGIEAYSCDLLDCSGGYPEYHFKDDLFNIIEKIKPNVLIAFPPCTYFSTAGACRLFKNGKIDEERFKKGLEAKSFFMKLYNYPIKYISLENPTPMTIFNLPKPTQVIQPYYFGDPYKKRTLLWLKNLPKLYYNKDINLFDQKITSIKPIASWVNGGKNSNGVKYNAKDRSKTFPGIAQAMAVQWSNFLKNEKL